LASFFGSLRALLLLIGDTLLRCTQLLFLGGELSRGLAGFFGPQRPFLGFPASRL
jgi:hypothetical protein